MEHPGLMIPALKVIMMKLRKPWLSLEDKEGHQPTSPGYKLSKAASDNNQLDTAILQNAKKQEGTKTSDRQEALHLGDETAEVASSLGKR